MINIKMVTDIGLVRKENEDTIAGHQNNQNDFIMIVADGMGGHNAGEVASKIACEIIGNKFMELVEKVDYQKFLKDAIYQANKEIYKQSLLNNEYQKMGTTLSAVIYSENKIFTGHVGDSRIYFLNEEKIYQITKDHTLIQAMIDSYTLNEKEASYSRYKNVLIQALGTSKKIAIEIQEIKLPIYYTILICSDGLTGRVNDDTIFNIFTKELILEERLDEAVKMANQLDGSDNVSIIALENRS